MAQKDKPPREIEIRRKLKRTLAIIAMLCISPVVLVAMFLIISYFWDIGVPYIRYKIAERDVIRSEKACIQEVGALNIPRIGPQAVLLKDGNVLIFGGSHSEGAFRETSTAELYNPDKKAFDRVGALRYSANTWNPKTFLMPNGQVLVTSSVPPAPSSSQLGFPPSSDQPGFLPMEVFDPDKKQFLPNGGLSHPIKPGLLEFYEAATLLSDGRIMFFGMGERSKKNPLSMELSADLYNPMTGEFHSIGGIGLPIEPPHLEAMKALTLKNGNVLLTTLFRGKKRDENIFKVFIYDPKKKLLKKLKAPKNLGTTSGTLLLDGNVLFVGGTYASPVLLDVQKSQFITLKGYKSNNKASVLQRGVLPSGNVILMGVEEYFNHRPLYSKFHTSFLHGFIEEYDPNTQKFQRICELQNPVDEYSTLTVLHNGDVLVTGGSSLNWDGHEYHPSKSFLLETH